MESITCEIEKRICNGRQIVAGRVGLIAQKVLSVTTSLIYAFVMLWHPRPLCPCHVRSRVILERSGRMGTLRTFESEDAR